jgi:hypothetical protein
MSEKKRTWKNGSQYARKQTAEVDWRYAQVLDPYGVDPDLPEECQCIGRAYFARSPETEVSVH